MVQEGVLEKVMGVGSIHFVGITFCFGGVPMEKPLWTEGSTKTGRARAGTRLQAQVCPPLTFEGA